MPGTWRCHGAGGAELARCRVVQLRRCEPHLRSVVAAREEALAVRQQSRGLAETTLSHWAGQRESAGLGFVHLGRIEGQGAALPARDKDSAIGQESCGLTEARLRQGTCSAKGAACRVVQFRRDGRLLRCLLYTSPSPRDRT